MSKEKNKLISQLNWLVVADRNTYDVFTKDCEQDLVDMKAKWVDITDNKDISSTVDSLSGNNSPQNHGVIFSTNSPLSPSLAQELMKFRFSGLPVLTLSEFYEQYWQKVPVMHLKDGWFVQTRGFNLVHDHIGLRVKRVLDLLFAVVGGLLTLPVCLISLPILQNWHL